MRNFTGYSSYHYEDCGCPEMFSKVNPALHLDFMIHSMDYRFYLDFVKFLHKVMHESV